MPHCSAAQLLHADQLQSIGGVDGSVGAVGGTEADADDAVAATVIGKIDVAFGALVDDNVAALNVWEKLLAALVVVDSGADGDAVGVELALLAVDVVAGLALEVALGGGVAVVVVVVVVVGEDFVVVGEEFVVVVVGEAFVVVVDEFVVAGSDFAGAVVGADVGSAVLVVVDDVGVGGAAVRVVVVVVVVGASVLSVVVLVVALVVKLPLTTQLRPRTRTMSDRRDARTQTQTRARVRVCVGVRMRARDAPPQTPPADSPDGAAVATQISAGLVTAEQRAVARAETRDRGNEARGAQFVAAARVGQLAACAARSVRRRVAGCARLNFSRTADADAEHFATRRLDARRRAQRAVCQRQLAARAANHQNREKGENHSLCCRFVGGSGGSGVWKQSINLSILFRFIERLIPSQLF